MQDMCSERSTGTEAGRGSMVSSSDVTGTAVYSPSGDHLGEIDHLMLDKQSGQIAYAVMSFGGFSGDRQRSTSAALEETQL